IAGAKRITKREGETICAIFQDYLRLSFEVAKHEGETICADKVGVRCVNKRAVGIEADSGV
ncbi:MAG: hypothetical protein QXS54_12355, partial [Candidatus Methanomethylicaceae archaeon]